MHHIIIQNLYNKTVPIPAIDNSKSVFDILQGQQIDWMHACGAKGRCTTCKMIVLQGIENLSPLSQVELKYREGRKLKDNERLACQSRPLGDISIRVAEANKMPHVKYSD